MCITKYFKLHYWPGFTFILFTGTFLTTYMVSVLSGHVYGFFPYISDTGTLVPESCIFAQMFNFGAIAMGITLYIRYRQIDYVLQSGDVNLLRKWNEYTTWPIGFISLGISIVANFQETNILAVHFIGAIFAFGVGSIYFLMQTRISYATIRTKNLTYSYVTIEKSMFYLRLFLSAFMLPLFGITGICGIISRTEFTGKKITWWTEKDGGFQLRLLSTFAEWILVIFMFVYVLTFTQEFKSLEFEELKFNNKRSDLKNRAEYVTNCV